MKPRAKRPRAAEQRFPARRAPSALALAAAVLLLAPSAPAQLPPLPGADTPGADGPRRNAGADPVVENCQVNLVDDVRLPAMDAGVLMHLGVKEGDAVESEAIVARLDDREPKQERRRAIFAYNRAVKQANNPISIEFARAQYNVAVENLTELIDTNNRLEKAVPEADVRQARLEARSSELRIDNAEHELDLAAMDANTAGVEVETAEMMIERRVIRAPFDGEVAEVFRQQQEWVSPGDPILRLIRLDTLKVDGFVDADRYSFAELKGCEVTVTVKIAGGRTVRANGRVTWVDQLLMQHPERLDGKIARFRAEIANRRERGEWLIQPNRTATMTVHLGTGGVAAARRD